MTQPAYAVILVHSTSRAMRVEKLLRDEGIACKMIPVPRHLGSDCGVCVRVLQQDVGAARRLMEAARVEIESIHTIGTMGAMELGSPRSAKP